MKKKRTDTRRKGVLQKLKQILRMMRMVLFILLIGFTHLSASVKSQSSMVNLTLKNVSLEQVLNKVEEQLKQNFFFKREYVDINRKIDVHFTNAGLDEMVRELFGEEFKYRVMGNVIVISLKSEEQQPKEVRITGMVKDTKGNALPGVTVLIKGTKIGGATDVEGKYALTVPYGEHILVFSMVGMQEKEEKVGERTRIDVILEESVHAMDEVVVNGMFSQNRNSYTGSVTTLKSEDILKVSQTNLLQALTILTPGMRIVENNEQGSNPNHIPEIIIRGTSSISASGQLGLNQPLIMLDGVEISVEQLYDLDIFEIDRVDVLKDASATAIYGDKASNGVIVVTRKRVTDSKLRVRYNFVPNVQFPDVSSFNFCNAAQKLEIERMYGLYDSPIGEKDEDYYAKLERVHAGVNTDWVSKPLRNSWSFNHSLNFSGRGGGLDYSANIRYGDTRGVMKGDFRQNYGIGFYFSYRYKDVLTLNFRSNWTKTDAKTSPYGNFSDFAVLNPYDMPKDENGEWNKILSYNKRNPLYDATTNSFAKDVSKSFSNSLNFRWDVIKGLYLNGTFTYAWNDTHREDFDSPESSTWIAESESLRKGKYDIEGGNGQGWNLQTTASYNLGLNKDNSSLLTVNIGGELAKTKNSSFSFSGIGFLKPALNDIGFASRYPDGTPIGGESINTRAGLFANLNLIVRNKYFLDASYRVSGNSNYGAKDMYAPFWSAGIGWNLHNENIFKDSWISLFRLRGSIGYVGNGNFKDIKPYTIYSYRGSQKTYTYANGTGAVPTSMGNDELKAERKLTLNFGVNTSFFHERIDINFDVYKETTKDMMLDISMPPSAGVTTVKANLGEKVNTGYEWMISAQMINRKDMLWRISLNSSHTKGKIKKISNALKRQSSVNRDSLELVAPKIQLEEGEPDDAIYAVRSLGIDPATGREVFIKKDGTYTFKYDPQDKVAFGSKTPKFEGSLSSAFTYKRLSVNIACSFTFGGYMYNSTRAAKVENIDPQVNVDRRAFTERWKRAGDIVDYIKIERSGLFAHSERFVEKQNELNIAALGIMYEINPSWVNRIGLKKLMVGVQFSDVVRFTTVKYERGTSYPYMRGFNFTISPTF